ncbi:hypothetical protein GQ44DRAFT_733889 [Phaeosphaeriaceae sp. PMI808]|nr:hypothetical protein GQ44DRAFT_733889 [Phaeosphaeriaceae sp. PMI808]
MYPLPKRTSTSISEHPRKTWPRVFSEEDRDPGEKESYVDFRLSADALNEDDASPPSSSSPKDKAVQATSPPPDSGQGTPEEDARSRDEPDRLLYFLRDDENDEPSCEEEEIKSFCDGWHRFITNKPDNQRRAWLDDRSWPTHYDQSQVPDEGKGLLAATAGQPSIESMQPQETTRSENVHPRHETGHNNDAGSRKDLSFREYKNPLSALTLFSHLDPKKRFGHKNLPDADRRLIYVQDITPPFVYALAETATFHQVPALKRALSNHLSRRPRLGVDMRIKGYDTFEMDFHLPFFALRKRKAEPWYPEEDVYVKPHRECEDISFLISNESTKPDKNILYIHKPHFAFTICGVSDCRWVAYAFVDTDFDPNKAVHNFNFDYNTINEDQIAADGGVNANHPFFNPQEYFLFIVSTRLRQAVDEWKRLIGEIERGMRNRFKDPPFLKALDEDAIAVSIWTQKALSVFHDINDQLSMTNSECKQFSDDDGDIHYFSDISNLSEKSQNHIQKLLSNIKKEFKELENLQPRIGILVRRCEFNAKIIEQQLMYKGTMIAKFGYSIAELMIVWISPAALVSAFFAIPEPFGNFPRTTVSFVAAIICVFTFLQLVVFVKGGKLQLGKLWREARDLGREHYPNIPRPAGRLQRRRETNDTLVGEGTPEIVA